MQFGINKHSQIFQRPQIAFARRARAIFCSLWKIYYCLFIPNYTRNHLITYTNCQIIRARSLAHRINYCCFHVSVRLLIMKINHFNKRARTSSSMVNHPFFKLSKCFYPLFHYLAFYQKGKSHSFGVLSVTNVIGIMSLRAKGKHHESSHSNRWLPISRSHRETILLIALSKMYFHICYFWEHEFYNRVFII